MTKIADALTKFFKMGYRDCCRLNPHKAFSGS